jgi:hypothetical protein
MKKIDIQINYSREDYKALPQNFRVQFERFFFDKIRIDLSLLAPEVRLGVQLHDLKRDHLLENIIGCDYADISDTITSIVLFHKLKIYWSGESPSDDVFADHLYKGHINFQFENYPNESEIKDVVDWHNNFLAQMRIESKKLALRKSYRFKSSVSIVLLDKEIRMRIKTVESEERIDTLLMKLNREYNQQYPDAINYLTLTQQPKGWCEAYIDLGYGGSDAIDYMLDAFNASDLQIEKITVS